jgi:hypothetical protein
MQSESVSENIANNDLLFLSFLAAHKLVVELNVIDSPFAELT